MYCLDSAVRELFRRDAEVVIVDDGSTNGSEKLCDDFMAAYPELFRVIHQSNQGISAARNKGIEASRGDWVMFCDADDFLNHGIFPNIEYSVKHYGKYNVIHFNHYRTVAKGDRWRPYIKTEHLTTVEAVCNFWNRNASHKVIGTNIFNKEFLTTNRIYFPETKIVSLGEAGKAYTNEGQFFMILAFNYAHFIKNVLWFGITHRNRKDNIEIIQKKLGLADTSKKDAMQELKSRNEYYIADHEKDKL